MAGAPPTRFRLPHWGWFLLVSALLVIAGIAFSKWLRYQREQKVIAMVESWQGIVDIETAGPEWLRQCLGEDRVHAFKLFDQIFAINLAGTEVSDAEIAQFSRLTHLRQLFLVGTNVTDAGLPYLAGLKELSYIALDNTKVTEDGVRKLRKALPGCDITY